ncbi:MAG: peptidylprolyl isomerase [Ignavibacteriales bacterium]|nr:peptidylprolyl isomerase [Ignavibacteriales bacterium]
MKKLFSLMLLFLSMNIFCQEVIDKIVAVVDNEIILKSELDYQVNYLAIQQKLNPNDTGLRSRILNMMMEDKLVYAQAELDSIVVSDEQVNSQLDYQINYFVNQYGSKEIFEQTYGMTVEQVKRKLFDDTRKNLMAQMLKQKKFSEIEATRREVEEFYRIYKDSIGIMPEKITIAHIFKDPNKSDRLKRDAKKFAQTLLDSLENGADFSDFAKRYSQDFSNASNGGDLGFVKRGTFVSEFESAAFALDVGEFSDIVESPFGFHIIQLLERRGESIHTRHILVRIKSDDAADLEAIDQLTAIRDSVLKSKNSFEHYARNYSDDKATSKAGGNLGTFELNQLNDKSILETVNKLKENEISFPKRIDIDKTTYGFHIVLLKKRVPSHKPTLETDYDEIKMLAQYKKQDDMYKKWIEEIKQNVFWEIRL